MKTSTDFHPQAERVRRFDQHMRDRLAASLQYLAEVAAGHLTIPGERLAVGIRRIETAPVMPECFLNYYALVHAIQDGDFDLAQTLFDHILDAKSAEGELEIVAYRDPKTDARSAGYLRAIDTDPNLPFAIQPIDEAEFGRCSQLIREAYDLIADHAPDLFGEIDGLLKTIMVGVGPTEKGKYTFDGASAFELWGSIVLNAREAVDVVDMVQTIAHESCHVMLFGYCIDDELTRNPDDERYRSPLRADPRPIDGIYHATFVLARMHYACEVLERCESLTPALKAKLAKEKAQRATSFYDGLGTLKAHARYSPEGKALIESAEAYMDGATGKPPAYRETAANSH